MTGDFCAVISKNILIHISPLNKGDIVANSVSGEITYHRLEQDGLIPLPDYQWGQLRSKKERTSSREEEYALENLRCVLADEETERLLPYLDLHRYGKALMEAEGEL